MADTTYVQGNQTIVYKASDFQTGLTVTGNFYHPDMTPFDGNPYSFTELANGLYYLKNLNMTQMSIYVGVIFEGGIPKAWQTFRIVQRFQ